MNNIESSKNIKSIRIRKLLISGLEPEMGQRETNKMTISHKNVTLLILSKEI
jgi:hypothetical protein